ncbi:MAG: hypothetical protein CVV27_10600 [Candidatus Melainabacteria bacterium HGW-Melainabacteria-1]|nr:MAG: hypothetical protein CVV27_10600 [Candidatus Melainabacteria bacterium HGW-Melainabacteria-1]
MLTDLLLIILILIGLLLLHVQTLPRPARFALPSGGHLLPGEAFEWQRLATQIFNVTGGRN